MFAQYTLWTTGLLFFIFAIISIRSGKWFYLLIHPYSMFCATIVWRYRYVSEIPAIADLADKTIAVGIILASFAFWMGYGLLKEQWVRSFTTRVWNFTIFSRDDNQNIPVWKLRFFLIGIVLCILGYYTSQYLIWGKFEYLFFRIYDLKMPLDMSQIPQNRTLILIGSRYILNFLYYVTIYFSLSSLFVILKTKSCNKNTLLITIATIVAILSITSLFFTGLRNYPVFVLYFVLIFIVLSFVNSERHFSLSAVLVLFIITFYSLFWLFIMTEARFHGIYGLHTATKSAIQKRMFVVQQLAMKQKEIKIPNDLNINQNLNQKIVINNTDQTTDLSHGHLEPIHSTPTIDDQNKTEQKLAKEKQFLQTYKGGSSISREIAWIMLYYGRHTNYLGFFYPLKSLMVSILPSHLKSKIPGAGQLIYRERKQGHWGGQHGGTVPGLFGEGYMSYGYVGGFFYWSLFSFFCGFLSKFATVNLFTPSSSIEITALSLFFYIMSFSWMYSNHTLFPIPLVGFMMVFIIEYLYIKICLSHYQYKTNN
jgi:hypothetical protein